MTKHYLNCRYYTEGPQARCNCAVLWWMRTGKTRGRQTEQRTLRDRDMDLNKEIEKFEAWWKDHQQASWNRTRMMDDKPTPPPNWGKGFKNYQLEGWLARASEEATR